MDMLWRLPMAIVEDSIAFSFALVIGLVLILALLARFVGRFQRFGGLERSGPTLLATLGVLGTFVGVAIGLLDFDVRNIDASVPQLLAGLKIAFLSSIIGLAASIILKAVQATTPGADTEEAEVTPEAIHATLIAIQKGIDTAAAQERDSLEHLRKSISADSDSSLLTQVQKLRTDFQDGQTELITEFRQFAETMAKNNSQALIEALEQVIRDFNTQLNEQFGDNFKQLNEAVGKLLAWQDNYREHVEALESRLEKAVQATEASEQALGEIAGHTRQIPETLQSLRDILKGLDEHLTTVAELKDKAIAAFPVIDDKLKELTDRLGESVERSDNALQRQQEAHNALHRGFDTLLEHSQQSHQQFEDALKDALSKAASGIEAQLGRLNQEMERTLHESIQSMGQKLASLSEKFVEDYGPLTEKLHKVVQMVQRPGA